MGGGGGGGQGQGVQNPPGKTQVIWVFLWNKQLEYWTPPLEKSWDIPPPGKMLDPSGTLNNFFFEINHWTSVK